MDDTENPTERQHSKGLKGFVHALAHGREPDGASVEAVRRLAAQTVRHRRSSETSADDLVASLTERLLRIPLASRDHHFGELLSMHPSALAATLKRRLVHQLAESNTRWNLVRLLREHCAAILESGVPTHAGDWPPSLLDGDRFSRDLIQCAIACAVREGRSTEPRATADALLSHYFPAGLNVGFADEGDGDQDTEHLFGEANPHEDERDRVRRLIDSKLLGAEIRRALRAPLLEAFVRDARGETLSSIAKAMGCSTTTAFARVHEAREVLRAVFVREASTHGTRIQSIRWLRDLLEEEFPKA